MKKNEREILLHRMEIHEKIIKKIGSVTNLAQQLLFACDQQEKIKYTHLQPT